MKQEIRARIDQIRQGIVPEGYKKTESGIIPNEWRVGQVSKCIAEYKFFSNDISHIPVYSSSRKGLVPQSDYYNQREAVETNLGYKVVPQGYVTYRHMSDDDVFHFNINKTGENVLVSSEYPVFTSSDNCDLSFLISVLNNTARFRYFCKMQKLGGTRTRLYLDNLKRYALALPPFDEQKKIAEILATQDKAIELQERKIDELKRFKKGCLEKMFPRKGQKVPEKRFPGFTDDWEQRKAKDLCSISTGKSNTQDRVDNGIYPFYVRSPIVEHSNRYLFDEEAVLTVGDGVGTGKVFHYVNGKYDLHQRVYRMFDFSEEITAKYFYYYFSNHFYDRVMTMTAKTSVDSVRYEMIADMDIALPKVKEQMAISAYFGRLDNLITLHQRKLEEMKKQKKALMQLLLTGIMRVRL